MKQLFRIQIHDTVYPIFLVTRIECSAVVLIGLGNPQPSKDSDSYDSDSHKLVDFKDLCSYSFCAVRNIMNEMWAYNYVVNLYKLLCYCSHNLTVSSITVCLCVERGEEFDGVHI